MRRIHWWSGAIGAAVIASAAFAAPTAMAAKPKPASHSVSRVTHGKVTIKGKSGGGDKHQTGKGQGDKGRDSGKGKGGDGRDSGGKGRDNGGKGGNDRDHGRKGGNDRDHGGKGGNDRDHGGKPKPPPPPPRPPYPPPCRPHIKMEVKSGGGDPTIHGKVEVNSAPYGDVPTGIYASDDGVTGWKLIDSEHTTKTGEFQATVKGTGRGRWIRAVVASTDMGSEMTPPTFVRA